MDKKTILAFLLIGLILVLTQTKFYREKILKLPPRPAITEAQRDSLLDRRDSSTDSNAAFKSSEAVIGKEKVEKEIKKLAAEDRYATLLDKVEEKKYDPVVIETDNYIAKMDPKGAVISSWILKKYDYTKDEKVELIENGYGNMGFFFIHKEDTLSTNDTYFNPNRQNLHLTESNEIDSIKFVLDLGDNRQIIKTFVFYKDQYIIDFKLDIREMATEFDNSEYFVAWHSGLKYTELDYSNQISKEDISSAKAYVFQGESKEELSLPDKPYQKKSRSDFSGVVDWTAIRTKYFAMIILPDKKDDIIPIMSGKTFPLYSDPDLKDRVNKIFSMTLKNKISLTENQKEITQHFRVYLGPLDYDIIKQYHATLSKIMDFGFIIFRPFAKAVLKVFIFLHLFIPNYGIVLIIFSLLVKVLVWPLTKKSNVSMQRMQVLQPKLNELKEKYGKDPQRLNRETMKLYKEEGINPVSGCIPQLLQMPLLIAIFIVFRSTIELRDAAFVWWINDLSAPDTIYQLAFSIPFYGNFVNVLPIIMGVTMFWQQKMTMKDPKQKAMVYFMPIFFTLIFNSFPSGLNLYYALFNIFSIAQLKWSPEKKIEQNSSDSPKVQQQKLRLKEKKFRFTKK